MKQRRLDGTRKVLWSELSNGAALKSFPSNLENEVYEEV